MLVLFLNELSVASESLPLDVARSRVSGLLKLLKKLKNTQQQIALNSQEPLSRTLIDLSHSLSELLGGDEFKDEWRFLRGFANRSPFAAEMDASFSLQVEEVEYLYRGSDAIALGWADQLGTAVISFDSENDWREATLNVIRRELDDAAEIDELVIPVRNFAIANHVDIHNDWLLGYSLVGLESAGVLWIEREVRFQHLRFIDRTKSDLEKLRVSGAAYSLMLKRLQELNQDMARWIEIASEWPEFSSKVTPESAGGQRQRYCKVMDNGVEHDFDLHLRFTGGMAGRIHFRICPDEKKAIIAYLGQKLTMPIVQ